MTKAEKAVVEAAMKWHKAAMNDRINLRADEAFMAFCKAEEVLDKKCAALAKARKK